jgi:small subunit ribosomal protein S4
MARYTESVCRLCRREGTKLFLKGMRCYSKKCAFERRPSPPGQHGVRRRKVGDYGLAPREAEGTPRLSSRAPVHNYFVEAGNHGVTQNPPPFLELVSTTSSRLASDSRAQPS